MFPPWRPVGSMDQPRSPLLANPTGTTEVATRSLVVVVSVAADQQFRNSAVDHFIHKMCMTRQGGGPLPRPLRTRLDSFTHTHSGSQPALAALG